MLPSSYKEMAETISRHVSMGLIAGAIAMLIDYEEELQAMGSSDILLAAADYFQQFGFLGNSRGVAPSYGLPCDVLDAIQFASGETSFAYRNDAEVRLAAYIMKRDPSEISSQQGLIDLAAIGSIMEWNQQTTDLDDM